MKTAEEISEQLGHNYMGTEHILIGLLDTEGVASKILVTNGLDKEKLMELIESYDGVLPFSDKASPETIRREADMSKKEFKRAVGRLYKDRRISIEEGCIRKL